MSRGFVLLEVSVSYVILSFALVFLIPVFIMALKANKATEKIITATYLSSELLEEVRMRKWDENSPIPSAYITTASALGRDTGETATDKTTYDDVDDFNGWTETGTIKDPLNRTVAGFPAFTRSITVQYVDSAFNVSAAATDYKKITACTLISGRNPVCLYTLVTNH